MENTTADSDVVTSRYVAGLVSVFLLQGVNVWSVVGNIITIIIIMKTPGLRGFSGALMVNQAVADILTELLTIALYFTWYLTLSTRPGVMYLNIAFRLGIFACNGVVAHSFSALSINLYLAICKQQRYREIMTWKRMYVILTMSWVINLGTTCLYLTIRDFYIVSAVSGDLSLNLTRTNCWLFVVVLVNIIAVPFCAAVVCYVRIHKFTKSLTLLALGWNNIKKLKLSQMIHIVTIIFLLTYIPVVVVISLKVETFGVKAAAAILNYSYHACKLFVYLKFYQPFRTTAKGMCCCFCCCRCCYNRVDVEGVGPTGAINVHTIQTSVHLRSFGQYRENTSI